jgi:penicillin-binding protein 1A
MERRYTKSEILEIYLNYMIMGPGVYGVEAASKYFFNHSAKDITLAESAILVIQLSNPSAFNPINHPNLAMERQRDVLNKMVKLGYAESEDAEASFREYWDNYDYTRASVAAYYNRDDKVPWFSEYVRRELDAMMYGSMDYYRDGYTVLTTLNMEHQIAAEKYMAQGLAKANKEYAQSSGGRLERAERVYIPIINLLSTFFDMGGIRGAAAAQNQARAINRYNKIVNPITDMAALVFGLEDLKILTNKSFAELKEITDQNVVEGALITIENETGYITAIVGGSKYDATNQLIRATQGRVMPGSSFKPLYYSAAFDTGKFTPSTLIYDIPIVFHNEDGTPYIPLNFRGEWKGSVLVYNALAQSMNVPSLKIMDAIGFDAAINRASALMDITDPETIRKTFPRVYPMGLGIISVAPIQMARAFSVFANQGRTVTPIAIRSILDRNGRMVIDNEKNIRVKQQEKGKDIQVISPQNAYVMTSILKKTVEIGTLSSGSGYGSKFVFKDKDGKTFRIPSAGKTGTTQNWSDAWTVGFTPYYTTAIWFGFDKPGNSLGLNLTGATLAGPVWGDYMRDIHQGLPMKDFARPATGVVDITVCAKSGLIPTAACNEGKVTLTFLSGTQPDRYCDIHTNETSLSGASTIPDGLLWDTNGLTDSLVIQALPDGLFDGLSTPNTTDIQENGDENNPDYGLEVPDYNPLLD